MNSTISANHDFSTVIESLPHTPSVLADLGEQLQQSDPDIGLFTAILRHDSRLASDLVRLGNGDSYLGVNRVETLEAVVMRLGQRETFNLAGAVTLAHLAREPLGFYGVTQQEFCANGLFTALLLEELAVTTDVEPHLAFLAGLLRSVGKIVLNQAVMRTAAISTSLDGVTALADWERDTCGYSNIEIGAGLLSDWHFPSAISAAIGEHYEPGRDSSTLAHLLNIAASAADALQYGFPGESDYWQVSLTSLSRTHLDQARIARAAEKARRTFERVNDSLHASPVTRPLAG